MTMRERQRQVKLYRGRFLSPGRPTVAWREDQAHRQADLKEAAEKQAEAVPWDRPAPC